MPDPNDHNKRISERSATDKSFHGLAVGLGLAVTIAATVIVFAYAATDGFSSPVSATTSESTSTAAAPIQIAIPTNNSDVQKIQSVGDKMQDQLNISNNVTQVEPIVQNATNGTPALKVPDYYPVDSPAIQAENKASETTLATSSTDTQSSKEPDPAPPASNTQTMPQTTTSQPNNPATASSPSAIPPITLPPISPPSIPDKIIHTGDKESNHQNDFKHHEKADKPEEHHKDTIDVKPLKIKKDDKLVASIA